MSRRTLKHATRGEHAYIRGLERTSAFELVDRGRARILTPEEYPEPLKRFLARERTLLHVKLSAVTKRKLEARSRQSGVPMDELARAWIEQGLTRDAG
ncbi:MAG: hypothetical protein V2A79_16270 [Planctomycetota bacterium]